MSIMKLRNNALSNLKSLDSIVEAVKHRDYHVLQSESSVWAILYCHYAKSASDLLQTQSKHGIRELTAVNSECAKYRFACGWRESFQVKNNNNSNNCEPRRRAWDWFRARRCIYRCILKGALVRGHSPDCSRATSERAAFDSKVGELSLDWINIMKNGNTRTLMP